MHATGVESSACESRIPTGARSTETAIDAIVEGLKWLGLDWDDTVVSQSANAARHAEIAAMLLDEGKAYRCFCSPAELNEMRRLAKAEGRSVRYDGRCRDRDSGAAPSGVRPALRFMAPREGVTIIDDLVQGEVRIANAELDDMVIARADGSPTYMLSVVVDDHDMGVTHVIRGDDHLNNAARQSHLFGAMAWDVPAYAHIPLIHGADGAKLSSVTAPSVSAPTGTWESCRKPAQLSPASRLVTRR